MKIGINEIQEVLQELKALPKEEKKFSIEERVVSRKAIAKCFKIFKATKLLCVLVNVNETHVILDWGAGQILLNFQVGK
ncbi:MAG: hypothetical protein ACKOW2_01985 [Sphingobacteriaceae bacterium]